MTTTRDREVRATNLGGELVRVEFKHSNVVSDHPERMGGSGKGPSPAVLLMSALVSSSVLVARQTAEAEGIRLSSAVARAVPKINREKIGGPLAARIYLPEIWRQVELAGDMTPAEAQRVQGAVADCPIAAALREGLQIDERVTYTAVDRPRLPPVQHSSFEKMGLDRLAKLQVGETEEGALEPAWRLSAIALGQDTALVDLGFHLISVGATPELRRGPSPTELLLGGLAACTAIYVSRFASFKNIPLERVNVSVSTQDDGGPLRRLTKVAELVGNLTPEEVAECIFFAEVCAIGQSLLQGVRLNDRILISQAPAGGAEALGALLRDAPPPSREADCDDGACCAPEFGSLS